MFHNITVIAQYKPTDATTNPSLLYAAAQLPQYDSFVQEAITFAKGVSRYVSWGGGGGGGGHQGLYLEILAGEGRKGRCLLSNGDAGRGVCEKGCVPSHALLQGLI